MKLLNYGQRLYAPVNDGGDGGGSGAGSPAVFDQAAFSAQILGEVSKAMAAQLKTFKTDFAKLTAPKPGVVAAIPDPDLAAGDLVIDPAAGDKAKPDPVLTARMKALEKLNNELREQFAVSQKATSDKEAAAELRDRHTSIREQLTGLAFGSDAQRDTAYKIFQGDIRRLEDGSLVGGDADTPIKEFIGEQMKQHAYLLAPKNVDSANARGGNAQRGAGKAVDFDSIKPGMPAADLAAARAEIIRVAQEAMRG